MEVPKIKDKLAGEDDAEKKSLTEELARMRGEEKYRESQKRFSSEVTEADHSRTRLERAKEFLARYALKLLSKEKLLKSKTDEKVFVPDPNLAFLEAIVSKDMKIEELERDHLTNAFPRGVFIPKIQNILVRLSEIESLGHDPRTEKKIEEPAKVAFMLCDLDHFSTVNSRGGHPFGDQILREVADVIKNNIRGTDLFCRWGGDEFLIAFPGLNEKAAVEVAEKIRGAVQSFIMKKYGELITSLSMGCFVYEVSPEIDKENVGKIFQKAAEWADAGAFEAKEQGRNRVVFANALSKESVEKYSRQKREGMTEK